MLFETAMFKQCSWGFFPWSKFCFLVESYSCNSRHFECCNFVYEHVCSKKGVAPRSLLVSKKLCKQHLLSWCNRAVTWIRPANRQNGPFKGVQQHAVRTTEFSVADVLYFELDFLTEKGSIIAIGSDKLHFGLTSFPCPPAIFWRCLKNLTQRLL